MREIGKTLEKLYYETDYCVRCGRCTTVCPTFNVTKKESLLARGRIRLVREYVEGKLDLSSKFKLYNDLCLECKACFEACPAGMKVDELISEVKFEIQKKEGRKFSDKLILDKVLASPQSFRLIIAMLGLGRKTKVTKLLPKILKEKEKIVSAVPKKSFFASYKGVSTKKKAKYRVGYFVGCLTNSLFPEIALDAIKVLEYHDCEVVIPKNVCCGLPHKSYGDLEKSRELALQNIRLFLEQKVDYIVTDCGTCGHALQEYKNILTENKDAKTFSEKCLDINKFLVEVAGLKVGSKNLKGLTVTYHDSCHLKRRQKVSTEPRKILKSLPGVNYVELPEADWCCGAAGTYSVKHQDVSRKILQRKVSNIKSTSAQYVSAGCPACLMQLDFGGREFGDNYIVKHPLQLLAQTLLD